MEQYEMPEFAVIGATVYLEGSYSSTTLTKAEIVKVGKKSVDVKTSVDSPATRYTLRAWRNGLYLQGFKSERYSAPRIFTEEDGLQRIARQNKQQAIEQSRYRLSEIATKISSKSRYNDTTAIYELINELKVSTDELAELMK